MTIPKLSPTNITSTVGYGLQAAGYEEEGQEFISRAQALKQAIAPVELA